MSDQPTSEPVAHLSAEDARALRMRALLLAGHRFSTPAQVVEWFGAMQAQDVASGHWSFGVRLPGLTENDITQATLDKQIVRTWPMRGTIHFVPPADAQWMLEVTGARQLRGLDARWQRLGLDESKVRHAADVLGETLADGSLLTRAECLDTLTAAGLDTTGQRGYHYLWYAAQIGVTVIGPQRGKEQTFTHLDAWVPHPNRPEHDEALGILAERYFRSHGPASVKDFAGWTALTMTEAKRAVAVAEPTLASVEVAGQPMIVAASSLTNAGDDAAVAQGADLRVLPGFDEYLLGFKDRSLMADPATMAAVIPGGNGIFRNTVVTGGQVRATWKRTVKSTRVDIEVIPVRWRVTRAVKSRLEVDFDDFARFLGVPTAVVTFT